MGKAGDGRPLLRMAGSDGKCQLPALLCGARTVCTHSEDGHRRLVMGDRPGGLLQSGACAISSLGVVLTSRGEPGDIVLLRQAGSARRNHRSAGWTSCAGAAPMASRRSHPWARCGHACSVAGCFHARQRVSSAHQTTPTQTAGASRGNSRASRCSSGRPGHESQTLKNASGRPRKDRHSWTISSSSHQVLKLVQQGEGGLERQRAFGLVQQVETRAGEPALDRQQVGLAVADLPRWLLTISGDTHLGHVRQHPEGGLGPQKETLGVAACEATAGCGAGQPPPGMRCAVPWPSSAVGGPRLRVRRRWAVARR